MPIARKPKKVLLDTNVWIYYFRSLQDSYEKYADRIRAKECKDIIDYCKTQNVIVVINKKIIYEIEDKCTVLNLFFDKSAILEIVNNDLGINYSQEDLDRIRSLDKEFERTFDHDDMLIYDLAKRQEIDEIITYDGDFKDCKNIYELNNQKNNSINKNIEIYHPYDYKIKFIEKVTNYDA
ncbi:MAG: PIN domain-containing protein [archaeon]